MKQLPSTSIDTELFLIIFHFFVKKLLENDLAS
jgi:hypothetical protein